MIRILQIGMSDNIGGIETFIINNYRKLDKKRFQFDFINMYDNPLCFEEEILSLGGKIYNVKSEKKHPLSFSKSLKKIIMDNDYKIVHIHKNSVAFIFSAKIAKQCGAKVIIHSHNTKSTKPNYVINTMHLINKKRIDKIGDMFYCCSMKAAEWMFNKRIINSDKLLVFNNSIDIKKFRFDKKNRTEIRSELNLKDTDIVVGHIGRFTKQKNHTFIIDIFNELHKENDNYKLMLIGKGPLEEEIKQKVNDLNLKNSVMFLGQKIDVNKYYQAMDIFLFPSLYEGLGIVGIEAQCSGLPCFFSSVIPSGILLQENSKMIDLNLGKKKWAEIINENSDIYLNRNDAYKKISECGFDIDKEIINLQNNYEKLLKVDDKNE